MFAVLKAMFSDFVVCMKTKMPIFMGFTGFLPGFYGVLDCE